MHNENVTVINAWQFEWTISGNKSLLMAWMDRKKKFAYSVLKPVHYFVFLNTLILEAMMGEKNYSIVVTSIYDVFCDFSKQRNSFFFFLVMPHSSSTVRWVNLLILTVRLKPLTERWNNLLASLKVRRKLEQVLLCLGYQTVLIYVHLHHMGFTGHRSTTMWRAAKLKTSQSLPWEKSTCCIALAFNYLILYSKIQ